MNLNPALAAVQYLPTIEQQKVAKLMERKARHNPRFRDRLDAAKAKAEADELEYEAWLCAQHEERQIWADVPF